MLHGKPYPSKSTSSAHRIPRLSIILRTLGFPAVPLHGQLSQSQRLGALSKFKSGGRKVLVATDVASRFVPPSGCLDLQLIFPYSQWSRHSLCRHRHQLRHPHALEGLHPPRRPYGSRRARRKVHHLRHPVRRRIYHAHREGHREEDGTLADG